MNDYVIFTDSGCDISDRLLCEWGVRSLPLTFRFSDDYTDRSNNSIDIKEFYDKMRKGGVAKTSAVNPDAFASAFMEILEAGDDILYLGFSSGLSTTYNSAKIAAASLAEKYPERRILTVDTLSASAGQGLLIYLATEEKKKGASIDEVLSFVERTKLKLSHWFTVDDLVYLKRGGRISPTTAFVGNMLGIKPVLHVDNDGHLVNVKKVRGRRNAIAELAEKYIELREDGSFGRVYISHGDCQDDAELLSTMIKSKCGVDVDLITDVGTVIGAHSGPGTLALFFIGKER